MQVSPQTQAVLLLTAHFSKPSSKDVKPLTPTEWGRFALWLRDNEKGPEALLRSDPRDLLSGWTDRQITLDRVETLLDRGSALAIAMEKWQRSGLWVLTRSDTDYPRNLKQRLKTASPPVLFGCGNVKLLNQNGIAVVGSRNASDADLNYASGLGSAAADASLSIVSGGARGIDEAAMLGALQSDGTAVGVLADSLLRACTSQKYRKHLSKKNLVLISSYYPDAGFNAGNAMGRNKYIYCLSNAAVVVHSGQRGGTWNGAIENLKKNWVPVWVKRTEDSAAGNADIVEHGAHWAPEEISSKSILGLVESTATGQDALVNDDLLRNAVHEPTGADSLIGCTEVPIKEDQSPESGRRTELALEPNPALSLYEVFLIKLEAECAGQAVSPDELVERLELQKTQLNTWLKQAVADKKVKKLSRPVRYEWQGDDAQRSMFED